MFAALRGLEEWGVRIIARRGRSGIGANARQRPRLSAGEEAAARADGRAVARDDARGRMARSDRSAGSRRKRGRRAFPPPGRGRPYVTGASFLVKAKRRDAWKKHVAQTRRSACRRRAPARDERALAAVSFRQQVDGSPQKTPEAAGLAVPERQHSQARSNEQSSLLDVLDNVLNRGAVAQRRRRSSASRMSI